MEGIGTRRGRSAEKRREDKEELKMGKSITQKILESHLVKGHLIPGKEIFIKVDQTLTHDINAVMTYLAFEAISPVSTARRSWRRKAS